MLVFTRRVGESIIIDGDLEVTVLRTNPRKALIGIETLRNPKPISSRESFLLRSHPNSPPDSSFPPSPD